MLGILPFAIGGSGPGAGFSFPLNQVFATEASNAINVPIAGITTGDQVVGAPTVSFTYSGFGTSKAVYGQIVDNATGRVLGNIATPIPLTLDGQSHTASVSPADIVYTAGDAPSLTLQIAKLGHAVLELAVVGRGEHLRRPGRSAGPRLGASGTLGARRGPTV